jgi:hypothetical protein
VQQIAQSAGLLPISQGAVAPSAEFSTPTLRASNTRTGMAENYRTGFIWEHFMKNHEARRAMKLVGFRPSAPAATGK